VDVFGVTAFSSVLLWILYSAILYYTERLGCFGKRAREVTEYGDLQSVGNVTDCTPTYKRQNLMHGERREERYFVQMHQQLQTLSRYACTCYDPIKLTLSTRACIDASSIDRAGSALSSLFSLLKGFFCLKKIHMCVFPGVLVTSTKHHQQHLSQLILLHNSILIPVTSKTYQMNEIFTVLAKEVYKRKLAHTFVSGIVIDARFSHCCALIPNQYFHFL